MTVWIEIKGCAVFALPIRNKVGSVGLAGNPVAEENVEDAGGGFELMVGVRPVLTKIELA